MADFSPEDRLPLNSMFNLTFGSTANIFMQPMGECDCWVILLGLVP